MPETSVIERSHGALGELPVARAPASRGRPRPPSLTTLVGLFLALAAGAIQLRPLLDNSFFWHLRTGHSILEQGVPRTDPFSFTASDTPWVVQSWLAEALYAAVDQLAGPFGLRVLRATICALMTYLMYRLAVRMAGDRVRGLVVTLPALSACLLMWNERPMLLGALAMVALVWLVEVSSSMIGRRPLLSLPVLFWLWANVHGSFALGVVYVAVHLAGRWLDGSAPWQGRERSLLLGTGLGLAACLANPFGLSLLTFPLDLVSRSEVTREIVEWKSPSFQGIHGMLFGVFVLVTAVSLMRARHRPPWRDVIVTVIFVGLGFWAARNILLAPLVCLPIVARAVAVRRESDDRRPTMHWAIAGVLAVLALNLGARAAQEPDYALDSYPVEAMEKVEAQGLLGGQLVTTDRWGGFVIHRYWPRQKVFIDDRYDMYPLSLIREYFDLNAGRAGWDDVLDRHEIDVVVWPVEKPLTTLLDGDDGWRRIHRDDLAAVWVRV